jgi:Restriction endonuclease
VTYNFAAITDHEFETLIADLLGAELGLRFEVFTAGRDQGIDLRCLTASRPFDGRSLQLIVQCKKWDRNSVNTLRSHLRRKERPKVEALHPHRYILATTVALSPSTKQGIVEDLSPWIQSTADVFGLDDVHLLLRKHHAVERNHFKLWLTSTEVLDAVVHAATHFRSGGVRERFEQQLKLWVPNPSFPRAVELLRTGRVAIISGPPGIGKTMLAEILLAQFASEGFSPVAISEDIDEAEAAYSDDVPQIFYYDDFLGRISAGEVVLRKNEDGRLTAFIDRISRSKNKLLVLTTREYVLREALARYERLEPARIERLRTVVRMEDYNRLIKAKILYNHLFFSDLAKEVVRAVASPSVYRRILGHSNYSPRIIQQVIELEASDGPTGGQFVERFLASLDSPSSIWQRIYDNLDDACRSLLDVMATLPAQVALDDLFEAYRSFTDVDDDHRYLRALRVLEETFIAVDNGMRYPWEASDMRFVRFRDPSVADFMWNVVARSSTTSDRLLNRAVFFDQCLLMIRGRPNHSRGDPLIRDGQRALAKALMLLPSDSLRYTEVHRSTPFSRGFERSIEPTEDRLSRIAMSWAELASAGAKAAQLAETVDAILGSWRERRTPRSAVVGLLKVTATNEAWREHHSRMIGCAVEYLESDLRTIEDIEQLVGLSKLGAEVRTADAAAIFEEMLTAGPDIADGMEEPSELEELIDTIGLIAGALGFDVDDLVVDLQGLLQQMNDEIDAHSAEGDWDGPSGAAERSDDGEIDAMFEGLGRAED